MFQDEISMLVAETFSNLRNYAVESQTNFVFDFEDEEDESFPDEVPGFFYHLQVQSSTFVIRILESDDLQRDYKKILKYPEDYPTLRLLEDSDSDTVKNRLRYFYCDTIDIARAVRNYLSNRRYPIYEEHVFNVSDPSDSWWIKVTDDSLTVYFKLSKTEQIDQLIKVGPLGDKQLANNRLGQFYGYFNQMFPVDDFSCNHASFFISTADRNNPNFQDFVKLFTKGSANHDFWVYLSQLEFKAKSDQVRKSIRVANYYLMELSVIRRFWKQIQKQLGS